MHSSDLRNGELGVDVYWDLWNCNSTGVYSGVQESSNGKGNGDDASHLNKTFLRSVQKADNDGFVQCQTNFPGHYSGRTTHHHHGRVLG